jgi:hypothetical protein
MVRSVSAGDGTAARLAPEGTSTVTTALPGEPGAKSAPPNQADAVDVTVARPGLDLAGVRARGGIAIAARAHEPFVSRNTVEPA